MEHTTVAPARPSPPRRAAAALLAVALTVPVAAGTLGTAAAAETTAPASAVVTTQTEGAYSETGTWQAARDPGYEGGTTRFSREPGATATWTLTAPVAGDYDLDVYHAASQDNAKAQYTWEPGQDEPLVVDQRSPGNTWRTLGEVHLDAGQTVSLTVTATAGAAPSAPSLNVITRADAVRIQQDACAATTSAPAEPVDAAPVVRDGFTVSQHGTVVDVATDTWSMSVDRDGFRYSLASGGETVAAAHPTSGLQLSPSDGRFCDAQVATLVDVTDDAAIFEVAFGSGATATVEVVPSADSLNLRVHGDDGTEKLRARTAGGLDPAYGLGELGTLGDSLNVYGTKDFEYYAQRAPDGPKLRFVSSFTVFPGRDLAQVVLDDGRMAVQVDDDATLLGVDGPEMDGLHYFFGGMETIYSTYKDVRNAAGYVDTEPDRTFFGVGYESYGALGYNTNQATITQSVTDYLAQGYPLRWSVTGSGFWPYRVDGAGTVLAQGTTSSFGMWGYKYPDADAYKQFFADNDLALILGLRQSFRALPEDGGTWEEAMDGPWSRIGKEKGYFIEDADGNAIAFPTPNFPADKIYLVDPDDPEAVAWFVELNRTWGADGFKEDHMFDATRAGLVDNALVNPINEALDADGSLVMVKDSAFSVAGSILRFNDTDYDHGAKDQDRTAIAGLAFAASGQPNFYPDIVGGRIIDDLETNEAKQVFLTRNAMLAAVSPSMSFGNEPWRMDDPELVAATLKAAQWHEEYLPYIYSAALDSYRSGYPYTATPLPIAYPDDAATYDLVSRDAKQYQWMLGSSLLVAPLYGSDVHGKTRETAPTARDVYLPEGRWTDVETGETFEGPRTLEDYEQPYGKVPAFVGGTGILVHASGPDAGTAAGRDDDTVGAQVFPVAERGSSYTWTDGAASGTVTADVADWSAVRVLREDTGAEVEHTVDDVTGAVEFDVEPGVDYRVEDSGAAPSVAVDVRTQCLAGKVYVAVRALNDGASPVDVELATPFGSRTVADVAPGASAYQAFATRASTVEAGTAVVTVTVPDGGPSVREEVAFPARTC